MQTLVIFDIPDDKIRNKIGVACKDYGLSRIQYSAFMGDINHNRRDELRQRLQRILGKKEGNIQMYPLCEKDIRLKNEIINRKGDEK
ncbi:MAG: CRISPR-associated endoribonuclease Cas2 [Syntrophomonadaceae bacterium]|nr:CRISPR-associated endoribonuclease Cas2 [Bacillota bacterium]MBT9148387.1 CRISPR-associated endoribonuclease Cas2 [Bacillota bacterium]